MKHKSFRARLIPLLLLAVVWLTACSESEIERIASLAGPRVWLDQPVDGAALPIGSFMLKAHARDTSGGVRQIAFLVNGVPVGSVLTDVSAGLAYAEVSWNASVPGTYLLVAVASSANGAQSGSDPARVCVGSACDQGTPAPAIQVSPTAAPAAATATHTRTLVTPTATRTRTPVPVQITPTRTATPVPPQPPPPPPPPPQGCTGTPNIASFSASPTTISAGGSATLSWGAVTNADNVSIEPGIGGVATPGSTSVSPGSTTTYTLIARCGNNNATRTVTVNVTQQQQPPPPPPPAAPSNLSLKDRACPPKPNQIQISWSDNSNNESGFSIYRRVLIGNTWGSWALRANVGTNTTQFTDTSGFTSDNRVEYYVQAYNAGGTSAQSNTLTVFGCLI